MHSPDVMSNLPGGSERPKVVELLKPEGHKRQGIASACRATTRRTDDSLEEHLPMEGTFDVRSALFGKARG